MSRSTQTSVAPAPTALPLTHASTREAVVLAPDGSVVCRHCTVADTFLRRLRGLMFRAELADDAGLFIRPAGSVHTCFMRFPIDVVFLDRDLRVLKVSEAVRPWRTAAARKAKAVLELPAGQASARGIVAGAQLTLAGSERRNG